MVQTIPGSLWKVIDEINHHYFFGKKIPLQKKRHLASWIADRIHLKNGYFGLFAPTEHDFENTVRTFTGEPITSGAGKAHVLGEEALNALVLLNVHNTHVTKAKEEAAHIIDERILMNESENKWCGFYCCGKCTVSYWRNLLRNSLPFSKPRLQNGLEILKKQQDGKGRWKRFPFYYTAFALDEMQQDQIKHELLYIKPALERVSNRHFSNDQYGMRKEYLIKTLLCKARKAEE